jgi:putative membrane protein
MRRLLKLLVILLLMALGGAFTAMNAINVPVDYYFGQRELPLPVVLLGALGLGALLGMLAGLGTILGLKRDNARLRRRERLAVEEVNNLRSIPIREP